MKIIRSLDRILLFVGAVGLILMMLHVSIDVVSKYIFNYPVPLTMEMVSYYYMTAVAFLPLAALERPGSSLVHVEIVYGNMVLGIRRVVYPAALLLAAAYCAVAAYAACKPALSALNAGSYAGSTIIVPTWPSRFLPIVGFAFLAIVLACKAIDSIRTGMVESDEASDELARLEGND